MHFFFAESLYFAFSFKLAVSVCMPHPWFARYCCKKTARFLSRSTLDIFIVVITMMETKVKAAVKKSSPQTVFFFAESLYFAFLFKLAVFECMPHLYITSKNASKYLHIHCGVVLFVLSIQTLFKNNNKRNLRGLLHI